MLATLRSQVEALGGLASGAKDEHLDRRVTDVEDAIAQLAERIDSLATGVESATTSLGAKEHELAALHRHFTESSTRIESIVDDIREALSALPEPGSASLDDLAERLERVEASTRKASETNARMAGELTGRIDVIDQRVAAVAAEVARAKTLWPVALRSLEARLDDAVHGHRPEPSATDDTASTSPPDGPADDLLAGLRDSLQAMETVAAEMARASDTLGDPATTAPTRRSPRRRRRRSRQPERRSCRYVPASPDPKMLRPLDTLLFVLGRYGSWARAWMVYRALVVLAAPERAQPRVCRESPARGRSGGKADALTSFSRREAHAQTRA